MYQQELKQQEDNLYIKGHNYYTTEWFQYFFFLWKEKQVQHQTEMSRCCLMCALAVQTYFNPNVFPFLLDYDAFSSSSSTRKTQKNRKRISFHFLLPKRERETGHPDVDARRAEIRITSHLWLYFVLTSLLLMTMIMMRMIHAKQMKRKIQRENRYNCMYYRKKCEGDSASLKSAVAWNLFKSILRKCI